jgi:hypothetical protein
MLVSVGSGHHHVEERHIFDVLELLDLVFPWIPYFTLLKVVVIVKYCTALGELGTLEDVSNQTVKVVFASFIERSSHAPSVGEAKN